MLSVFIADDDKIIRQGLRLIVESWAQGEVVGEAADGETALEFISKHKIDLLITDIKMPVMNGIELIHRINAQNIATKIIVLSGFDEYQYVRDALKNGAVDYLLKPIQKMAFTELLERIREDIDLENTQQQNQQQIQVLIQESSSLIKEKFLLDLIKGNDISAYESRLGGPIWDEHVLKLIVVIGVDRHYLFNNLNFEELVLKKISLLMESTNDINCTAALENAQFVLLMSCQMPNPDNAHASMQATLISLLESLKSVNPFTFTAGVSEAFYRIESAHIAFQQSVSALNRRFFEGTDKMINYVPDSPIRETINKKIIHDSLKDIVDAVELGDSHKTSVVIHKLFEEFDKSRACHEKIRNACMNLIQGIYRAIADFEEIATMHDAKNGGFLQRILDVDTFAELRGFMADTIYNMTQKINNLKQEKSTKVIEVAKSYILHNYNQEISLKSVAEHVYLNPSYFSILFKNETGSNFISFLIDVRIQHAKKLLANPGITIAEVGRMVGYEEHVSFGRAFKKTVGVSPAEYRKIIH